MKNQTFDSSHNRNKNKSQDLWDDSLPWPLPAASDELINRWEKRHNLKLPECLKKLYKVRNGGYLKKGSINGLEKIAGLSDDDNHIFGLTPASDIKIEINELHNGKCKDFISDCDKVFYLDGDGHYHIALDFTFNNDPEVIYIERELGLSQRVIYKNCSDLLQNRRFQVKTINIGNDLGFNFITNDRRLLSMHVSDSFECLCQKSFDLIKDDKKKILVAFYWLRRLSMDGTLEKISSFEASLFTDIFKDFDVSFSINDDPFPKSSNVGSWRKLFIGFIENPTTKDAFELLIHHYAGIYVRELRSSFKQIDINDITYSRSIINPCNSPVMNGDMWAELYRSMRLIDNYEIRYVL
ncbi:MAG: hypothetical protein RL095_1150 [Verrucomicrobiota bacterium]|jgi:hypothetical protein